MDCAAAAPSPEDAIKCHDLNNRLVAIVALNIDSGEMKWSRKTVGLDNWTVAYLNKKTNPLNCPEPVGPDYGKLFIYKSYLLTYHIFKN
jgi:polyvinyl alcohol dehydrogenase (cytochrome)